MYHYINEYKYSSTQLFYKTQIELFSEQIGDSLRPVCHPLHPLSVRSSQAFVPSWSQRIRWSCHFCLHSIPTISGVLNIFIQASLRAVRSEIGSSRENCTPLCGLWLHLLFAQSLHN